MLAYLDERLKPLLLGEDPLAVERLWERMYRGDRGVRRVGIAGMALSALDIGLWDLAGKAAKLPLYKLWGAVTDRDRLLRQRRLGQVRREGPRRRGRALRRPGLPLLQDEDPRPRPAR